MLLFEGLDQVAWDELFHQEHLRLPATDVPVLLRALAANGPNHAVAFDANSIHGLLSGEFLPGGEPVSRSAAVALHALMKVSPVTPQIVPFIIELIASEAELPTRRLCARWLQSFFKLCTTGFVTATFDLVAVERAAAWVERMDLPEETLNGDVLEEELGEILDDPRVERALVALQEELGEGANVTRALAARLSDTWRHDTWNAIVAGLDVVLAALDVGDEALSAEVIALVSWLQPRADVIAPRLETLVREDGSTLLATMALLALARLQHPGLATSIAVMGDSLESRGERGAPAIYLAAADVLASKGLAHPRSRRALHKVAPELARLPDPFSTTLAELVKQMVERLVWPKR